MLEWFDWIAIAFLSLVFAALGYWIGSINTHQRWLKSVPTIREESIAKSKSVLAGLFSEQLAPYLPNFRHHPGEARFIGKPIDFIVFKGLSEKEPTEIVFVEVKTGKSTPSTVERKIRGLVESKQVRWEEYRPPW